MQWALLTACRVKDLLAKAGEEQSCPGPLRQSSGDPSGLQVGEKKRTCGSFFSRAL